MGNDQLELSGREIDDCLRNQNIIFTQRERIVAEEKNTRGENVELSSNERVSERDSLLLLSVIVGDYDERNAFSASCRAHETCSVNH